MGRGLKRNVKGNLIWRDRAEMDCPDAKGTETLLHRADQPHSKTEMDCPSPVESRQAATAACRRQFCAMAISALLSNRSNSERSADRFRADRPHTTTLDTRALRVR